MQKKIKKFLTFFCFFFFWLLALSPEVSGLLAISFIRHESRTNHSSPTTIHQPPTRRSLAFAKRAGSALRSLSAEGVSKCRSAAVAEDPRISTFRFNSRAFKGTAIEKDTTLNSPFSAFRYTDISLRSISALNDRKCRTTNHQSPTTIHQIY